ncbi:MAG: Hsp20/alpha crystallin family protein [Thermodesulfobacteriota bacterium]
MITRRLFDFPSWGFRDYLAELEPIRRQLSRIMENIEGGPRLAGAGVFPPVNLTEAKDVFYLRAELPGVKAGDLDIQATGNSISISGERKLPDEGANARFHRREREAGRFSRMIKMPGDIDADKIKASLVNGILTITVPKSEAAKPRQISIN